MINTVPALVGSVIGATAAGITASINGNSVGDIIKSSAIGGAVGFASGFTLGAAGTLVVGGSSAGLGTATSQWATNDFVNFSDVMHSVIAGTTGSIWGLLARKAGYLAVEEAIVAGLATVETQSLFDFEKALDEINSSPNNRCK